MISGSQITAKSIVSNHLKLKWWATVEIRQRLAYNYFHLLVNSVHLLSLSVDTLIYIASILPEFH